MSLVRLRLVAAIISMAASMTSTLPLRASSVNAQERAAHVAITIPTLTSGSTFAVRGVLDDRAFDGLLRNGFPVRIHVRSELWRTGRWFDDVVGTFDWWVIVQFATFDNVYDVRRVTNDSVVSLGTYKRFEDARAAAEVSYAPPLPSPARGREHYLAAQVDVQAIEMNDLDEVQRWLRGEAKPAVQGKKNPGTALTRGLRTLVTRVLGGEVRHLEEKSPTFRL